jgi:hypothetical protein
MKSLPDFNLRCLWCLSTDHWEVLEQRFIEGSHSDFEVLLQCGNWREDEIGYKEKCNFRKITFLNISPDWPEHVLR